MEMFGSKNSDPFRATLVSFLLAIMISMAAPAVPQDGRFEEIVVNFDIPKLINTDISVQYDGQTIYLPLLEVFRLLEANCVPDHEAGRIHGYIVSPQDSFSIDLKQGLIRSQGTESVLPPDEYLYNGNELYLDIDLMARLFKLVMQFDFSKLQVSMTLNQEFPAYQNLREDLPSRNYWIRRRKSKRPTRCRFIMSISMAASPTG